MTAQGNKPSGPLEAAAQFIRNHDRFLVVSHLNPDGDAIGSTLAVGWMLEHMNKTFQMVNEDPIPPKYNFLWGSDQVGLISEMPEEERFDAIISLDCADIRRMGPLHNRIHPDTPLLNIDHHATNEGFGSCVWIEAEAAATAELLYDLVNELQIPWTTDLANCIYTGLLTDTGGFRYSNASPKVLLIASEMLGYGVKGSELANVLLEKMTYAHLVLLQKSLAKLSFAYDRKIAWISVTVEDTAEAQAVNEDMEGLVNYPRNIEGVEVGLLFKEIDNGTFKVSLRSNGKVDVARIAKSFGGGGHTLAAGCTLHGDLDQVTSQLIQEVGLALE
ncbi:bifunctional oligoribonuclease/PAP phosphatase NrnA [Paenibacillus sp. J2TS4]|uniref:DHH family phosphoesterase n=1 Tax=Paenibacillus sp. J2TS4 TaxID=2807194 RepID=UPI001B2A3C1F|nr:bifunctional oligoribonuclease/PAP phosphatase NrnA [Paenibacillus sp. J2TS4]GIP33115.1 phosphoesterase [Paenibacillus sp. J2TS4]